MGGLERKSRQFDAIICALTTIQGFLELLRVNFLVLILRVLEYKLSLIRQWPHTGINISTILISMGTTRGPCGGSNAFKPVAKANRSFQFSLLACRAIRIHMQVAATSRESSGVDMQALGPYSGRFEWESAYEQKSRLSQCISRFFFLKTKGMAVSSRNHSCLQTDREREQH